MGWIEGTVTEAWLKIAGLTESDDSAWCSTQAYMFRLEQSVGLDLVPLPMGLEPLEFIVERRNIVSFFYAEILVTHLSIFLRGISAYKNCTDGTLFAVKTDLEKRVSRLAPALGLSMVHISGFFPLVRLRTLLLIRRHMNANHEKNVLVEYSADL